MFKAGVARRVITPDPLLPVTAGPGNVRYPTELLMDLELRALVIEQGGTRLAILSMPFIGWTGPLYRRVCGLIQDVPRDQILISATHTHTAPDVYGLPGEDGETIVAAAYLDWVCTRAADAVAEAVAGLKSVQVKLGAGTVQGQVAYNLYAPQLFDSRCAVMQFIAEGTRNTVATLVNYAIHPEVLLNQPVCGPDLVGPLCTRLDESLGGTTLFVNGAQGGMVTADIRHPDGDRETWAECERIGHALADEVRRILASAQTQRDPELRCARQVLRFPVNAPMAALFEMADPAVRMELDGDAFLAVPQHLLQIGPARVLTIPGEALPNIGSFLKRKLDTPFPFLFGLTNDALGYMLSRADYDSFPVYEYISATSLGEETGEILMDGSLRLLKALVETSAASR